MQTELFYEHKENKLGYHAFIYTKYTIDSVYCS